MLVCDLFRVEQTRLRSEVVAHILQADWTVDGLRRAWIFDGTRK
jgi:hypothetical protein